MDRRYRSIVIAACALACASPWQVSAAQPLHWHDVKCARYRTAWSHALERLGTAGLGQDFLASHDAFLASNCTRRADVCPRSAQELALANVMVIMSMNFGSASSFAPFACR